MCSRTSRVVSARRVMRRLSRVAYLVPPIMCHHSLTHEHALAGRMSAPVCGGGSHINWRAGRQAWHEEGEMGAGRWEVSRSAKRGRKRRRRRKSELRFKRAGGEQTLRQAAATEGSPPSARPMSWPWISSVHCATDAPRSSPRHVAWGKQQRKRPPCRAGSKPWKPGPRRPPRVSPPRPAPASLCAPSRESFRRGTRRTISPSLPRPFSRALSLSCSTRAPCAQGWAGSARTASSGLLLERDLLVLCGFSDLEGLGLCCFRRSTR